MSTIYPNQKKPLPSGATVEEIESMDVLHNKWMDTVTQYLGDPFDSHGREVVRNVLLEEFKDDPADYNVVKHLAQSGHFEDDRVLKLIGRMLVKLNQSREQEGDVTLHQKVTQLENELHHQKEANERLRQERSSLTADVGKLVRERDEARRKTNDSAIDEVAKLSIEKDDLAKDLKTVQAAYQKATQDNAKLKAAFATELERALNDYESEVVKKLASVAEDHNKQAERTAALRGQLAVFEARREKEHEEMQKLNISFDDNGKLRVSTSEGEVALTPELIQRINQSVAQVKKERAMNSDETKIETTPDEASALRCGDEVYTKVSAEGPFVLMTQVDEALIEYANPISTKKNHFHAGKLPVYGAWLVRCKDGTFRTFPSPALTKTLPKRSFSFGGVKRVITADVTAKLFQAAVWITMLTYLFMQH